MPRRYEFSEPGADISIAVVVKDHLPSFWILFSEQRLLKSQSLRFRTRFYLLEISSFLSEMVLLYRQTQATR